MKLLIVDDNPTNLKLLSAVLEAEGLTVFEAVDGVAALQFLERTPVDAVISDVLMPRMDGYRLCFEVRQHARLKYLPFIIYTATYTSPSDEKLSRDLGANSYLKKPASAKVIMDTLRSVTNSPPPATPQAIQLPAELNLMREYNQVLVDKLEQKNTELHTLNAELRQLLAHSPAVIYTFKCEDPEPAPVVASENIDRLLGVTAEESTRPGWWRAGLHPEDRDRVLNSVSEGLKGRGYSIEYRIQHKDGTYRWIEDSLHVVQNISSQPRQTVGVWIDITSRKNTEHLALRSQRLEALGTMAGGVAHDLNNALAPVMLCVGLLRSKYPGESKYIDIIQASTQHGANMVRQLVTFAKGAEGERVSLQPGHLAKEIRDMMRESFPPNIQIVVKCDAKLLTVLGDATQLHQVLLNLCVNARDAMAHGGILTLSMQNREVDAAYCPSIPDARPGHYVVLQVKDTGMGIPPAIIDRIFEPFFTTKSPDKGTGLGLSAVLGIVKGHGGFLQVYSQPGQGSTLTVYLPAQTTAVDPKQAIQTSMTIRGQGETILFVDDEAVLREVGRIVLRDLNFTPLTATDGADGLIQTVEHRTELHAIITDLHMPHMDGLAFVRALRRVLPEIPVVVISGRFDESMIAAFKTLGRTVCLDKPFTTVQLAEALEMLLLPRVTQVVGIDVPGEKQVGLHPIFE